MIDNGLTISDANVINDRSEVAAVCRALDLHRQLAMHVGGASAELPGDDKSVLDAECLRSLYGSISTERLCTLGVISEGRRQRRSSRVGAASAHRD